MPSFIVRALRLGGQQRCKAATVVGERIDPREAVGDHLLLHPDLAARRIDEQLAENAVVAVARLAAITDDHLLAEDEILERRLGLVGHRPGLEIRRGRAAAWAPACRSAGPDEAGIENDRVAVDDLGDGAARPVGEPIAG